MIGLAIVMPALAAYLVLRHSWGRSPSAISPALAASAAPGLGVAAASSLYFVLLLFTGIHRQAVRLDLGIWVTLNVALLFAARRGRHSSRAPAVPARLVPRWTPDVLLTAAGCLALAAIAAVSFWLYSKVSPHGEWDAWAIWNLRARSIFRGVPDWAAVFSPVFPGAEYPPLLPVSVARLWAYTGHESAIVPVVVAFLFLLSSTSVIVVSVGQLRGWASGWLAGMVLLAARTFVFQSSSQCADAPLAFFMLTAIVFVVLAREARQPAPLLLAAGAAAAFAALTKNEGELVLALVALLAVVIMHRLRAIAFVIAGAAIPALVLLYLKLRLTISSNYLFSAPATDAFTAKLFDGARWAAITSRLADLLTTWGDVPGGAWLWLAIVVGLTIRLQRTALIRSSIALLTVGAMLFAYVVVYVLTPLNVQWQIAVSFDRLVVQLWPALVWGGFQLTGGSQETPSLPL